eukprot:s529_g7.t1
MAVQRTTLGRLPSRPRGRGSDVPHTAEPTQGHTPFLYSIFGRGKLRVLSERGTSQVSPVVSVQMEMMELLLCFLLHG